MFTLQNLGASYQEVGDYDNADQILRAVRRARSRATRTPRRALAHTYQKAKRYEDARQQLAIAIELEPQDYRSWNSMGKLYCELENWAAAARAFPSRRRAQAGGVRPVDQPRGREPADREDRRRAAAHSSRR